MNDNWYAVVDNGASLTQGDLIQGCPLLEWKAPKLDPAETASGSSAGDVEALFGFATAVEADVVVMTQACDLEHGKVSNVVLCPCLPLSKFKTAWEQAEQARNQNPTAKAWRRFCDDVTEGYLWNLFMMNSLSTGEIPSEHRVVDFHYVYTAPRTFLDGLIRERAGKRLRLLPPYREHLSQSFARYFLRVGLPENVTPAW